MKKFAVVCFLWIVFCWNITVLANTASSTYRFPYTESIKLNFERNFYDQCGKYPFVKKYQDLLENPNGRYFMFVVQEPYLKNGGWGDRLSGMITSVELAIRFNRTLLLRSHNYLHLYFRPFHPIDIHQPTPKYTWENWLEWSGYQMAWANHDSTEYDLYDCINNSGVKNDHCSMEEGDASTPTILYRSNRCYLCRIDNGGHGYGESDFRSKLGVKTGEDLFEVAGCMLRLAIWPTENMWQLVDNYYADATKQFGIFHPSDSKKKSKKRERRNRYLREKSNSTISLNNDIDENKLQLESLRELLKNPWSAVSHFFPSPIKKRSLVLKSDDTVKMETNIAIYGAEPKYLHPELTQSTHPPTASPSMLTKENTDKTNSKDNIKNNNDNNDNSNNNENMKDNATKNKDPLQRSPSKPAHHNSKDLSLQPFLQLSVHFRCGDWSYYKDGDRSACVFTNSELNAGSFYMQQGNPVLLANCLLSSFQNHTLDLIHNHRRIITPVRLLELSEQAKAKQVPLTVDTLSSEGQFVLVYLTSDSAYSSEQMQSILQYNHTVVAPPGCHIEHNTSLQCLELTVVQWFILSLSAHIVVQTENGGTPVSAFSRYAGIYRLQNSNHADMSNTPVLLDGRHCAESPSHKVVAKLQQGNWFC